MTEIYLHIVARMADYRATHPYMRLLGMAVIDAATADDDAPPVARPLARRTRISASTIALPAAGEVS